MRQAIVQSLNRSSRGSASRATPLVGLRVNSFHRPRCPSTRRSRLTLEYPPSHCFHTTRHHHRAPPPPPIKVATKVPQTEPRREKNPKGSNPGLPEGPNPSKPKTRKKRKRWVEAAIVISLLCAFPPVFLTLSSSSSLDGTNNDRTTLNQHTFVPFTITSREQVSPTAFLLTVEPPPPPPASREKGRNSEVIARAWRHGLWSVEVKQPQLQVAREYTPLPPPREGGGRDDDGKLRFYIRRMDGGEVSGYLSRLQVGETMELRGPHLGFDVCARAGVADGQWGDTTVNSKEGEEEEDRKTRRKKEKKKKKVVFLAGGTGIAPALQAASALLDKTPGVEMEVVWANRRREDCVGCGGDDGGGKQGVIVALLEDSRRRYGDRFRYSCTVDEEGSFIDAGTIIRSTEVSTSAGAGSSPSWRFWSRTSPDNSVGSPAAAMSVHSDACTYHSPKKLVTSDDRDPPAGSNTEQCQCEDGEGNRIAGGKNLLMVSGPEGFIAHYAGAKVWGAGKELQGPVKGVISQLKRTYPTLGEDWLVLKM